MNRNTVAAAFAVLLAALRLAGNQKAWVSAVATAVAVTGALFGVAEAPPQAEIEAAAFVLASAAASYAATWLKANRPRRRAMSTPLA